MLPATLSNNPTPAVIRQTYQGVTTIKQALSLKENSLQAIKRNGEEKFGKLILAQMLGDMSDFLELKKGFTSAHIEFIVDTLFEDDDYKWMNIVDYHVICYRIKKGEYETFFENLNAPKFLKIVRKYHDERMGVIEQQRIEENNQFKHAQPSIEMEAVLKQYQKARKEAENGVKPKAKPEVNKESAMGADMMARQIEQERGIPYMQALEMILNKQ